jgi:hypothetical protein
MKNHHIQLTLASIAILSLLFSCAGQSSNPLDKYPGMKVAPPSDTQVETQTIAQPDLFEIEVNGSNEINQGQFIEGQNSSALIRVISKSAQVQSYKIEMTDFSSTERPTLNTTKEANVFSLDWAPQVGIIPGGQLGKTFKAQFLITVTAAENQLLVGLAKTKSIDVVVNRNNAQPQIIGRTDLKKGVDEGTQTAFTVDVEDKASAGSPRIPEMQITPYVFSNTEAYRANASQYVILDDSKKNNPERIGDNRFRFYYILDVNQLPLNRDRLGHEVPASPSVDICFQMRAVSSVATLSDQIQICTTARYAAQAPQLTFNEPELQTIKSGQDNTISFRAHADHPQAVLTIKSAATQIAGLTGTKTLGCAYETDQKKNDLICVLKWKPTCRTADAKKTLTLKVDNVLDGKAKSTTETKEVTILADPAQCVKPKTGAQ